MTQTTQRGGAEQSTGNSYRANITEQDYQTDGAGLTIMEDRQQ